MLLSKCVGHDCCLIVGIFSHIRPHSQWSLRSLFAIEHVLAIYDNIQYNCARFRVKRECIVILMTFIIAKLWNKRIWLSFERMCYLYNQMMLSSWRIKLNIITVITSCISIDWDESVPCQSQPIYNSGVATQSLWLYDGTPCRPS